jgi:hypothetical protein
MTIFEKFTVCWFGELEYSYTYNEHIMHGKSELYLRIYLRKDVNLSVWQALEGHRIVRRRSSHIFYTIGSEMALRLSALGAMGPFTPIKIPGTYFC